MQSRRLLQFLSASLPLILFIKAQDVIGSGPSCVTSRPGDGGQTRVSFLREEASGVRSLYLTLWSEDMRLVSCEVTSDPRVTEKYGAHCARGGTRGRDLTRRFNISMLLAPDAPCALASFSAPKFTGRVGDGTEGRPRRKRAWIFPGTLWCGTGSRAKGYDQLGMFERADRCCREHDHCQHFIPALTKNYGVFNSNYYTVSHCDCDKRFRWCLLGVNDTISSMVAYSFFNILKVPCFEFKQQRRCTQMHWRGMCKDATEALHAVFKSALPFHNTDVASNNLDDADSSNVTSSEGQHVTESPVISPHTTKRKHRCGSGDPHSRDTFYHRRKKGKGCKRHRKLSRAHNTTPSMETSLSHSSKSTTLIPTKKSDGKKKSLSSHPTQRSQNGSQVTTNSYPQTIPTTHQPPSPPAVTETTNKRATTHQPPSPPATTETTNKRATTHQPPSPPATTETTNKRATTHQSPSPPAITETTNKRAATHQPPSPPATTETTNKRATTHQPPSPPATTETTNKRLRGDIFQPHCKSCLEQKTTPHIHTAAPPTTTYDQPIEVTTPEMLWLKMTTETPEQNTSSTNDYAILTSATLKAAVSVQNVGTTQKQMDSNTSQEVMGRTKAPNTERRLKPHAVLHNMTDSQLLCLHLNRLDECKYKIHPLEKKYNLQNTESKTAYHCDCTNRLAGQIKSFKKPSILPTLLMDFVSQYCFNLPKEEDCHSGKSCSGGFTKASDLLQALKKIERKDIGRVWKSGRKRRNPVRLSKRCLRLERNYIMAQLT